MLCHGIVGVQPLPAAGSFSGSEWNDDANAGLFKLNGSTDVANRNRNWGAHSSDAKHTEKPRNCPAPWQNISATQNDASTSWKNFWGNFVSIVKKGIRMKRYNNIFKEVVSMDNLFFAAQKAQRGKRNRDDVQAFNRNADELLADLQVDLVTHNYHTSPYTVFELTERDKTRRIYRLPFYPDRVCQWALVSQMEPYLMRHFTADTYSALPGRGISLARKRLHSVVRRGQPESRYCLKMDISKYYPSINHDILKDQYRRIFKDADLLWLVDEIIDSTPGDTGIPIGNYLSQYSANLYLSWFDHWVKEAMHVKHYYRYMDDMVFLGSNKRELHELERVAIDYLETKLKLHVKRSHQVFPVRTRGIDFLGYREFGDYVLMRKSTVKRFKRAALRIHRKLTQGGCMSDHDWHTIYSYYSYRGWLEACDGHRLYDKYTRNIFLLLAEREHKEREAES